MAEGYLRYGVVAGPHGLQGSVYLIPYSGDSSALAGIGQIWLGGDDPLEAIRYPCTSYRTFKKGALLRLAGVSDRTAADPLKGRVVWVARADLPPLAPGEWYLDDLRGAVVRDALGIRIGTVEDFNYGAGGIMFVIHRGNRAILIPWVAAFVSGISPSGEVMLTERAPLDL